MRPAANRSFVICAARPCRRNLDRIDKRMLDEIASLSWRWYPATALIGLGAVLALWGLRTEALGLRDSLSGDHSRIVIWIQGFRLSIIGLALAGIGAAWALHLTWLLVQSLAIGGE